MNLLYWCEIADCLPLPPFGGEFADHMAAKRHPGLRSSSLSAWHLLALALRSAGREALPKIAFSPSGKPYIPGEQLHFSLSHSGRLASALISDAPCGVDVQLVQEDVRTRLERRCLSPREAEQGCDFFEVWTKKECIAKLDGSGMPAHPGKICTLGGEYSGRFFSCGIQDSAGNRYVISALCDNAAGLRAEKRTIIIG